jgi:succinate dehydrogenase / fumarate reductase iron-sulfur subunit
MTTNVSKSTANVRVQRFNPESDRKPRIQEFRVEITQDTTILDALHEIKSHQDGSLTYRRSCRHAICGSCAMNVNGKNMLVCKTPLKDHLDWLLSLGDAPEKEFRMSPDEVAGLQKAETCIMCGACYSSCTVVAGSKRYIGPHALLKSYMRVMDPRDSRPGERLVEVGTDEGVFRCHTIFNCIDACPKNLDPTKAIETLRQLVLKRKSFEAARQERQKTLDKPVVVVE